MDVNNKSQLLGDENYAEILWISSKNYSNRNLKWIQLWLNIVQGSSMFDDYDMYTESLKVFLLLKLRNHSLDNFNNLTVFKKMRGIEI